MPNSLNFHPDGTLFIVSGPSGAGKTTLISSVRSQLEPVGIRLYFSVSHTTRAPRAGELDTVNYHYVSRETFDAMADAGEFIECAEVHGNSYGTSRSEVSARLERGEDVILDIDYQGALQIAEDPRLGDKKRSSSIFIFPPSIVELRKRLESRGLNSDQEIEIRVGKALDEIKAGKQFYDYVIINDDLNVAVECLKASIIAKKLQTKTALAAIDEMAERFKEERNGRIAGGY